MKQVHNDAGLLGRFDCRDQIAVSGHEDGPADDSFCAQVDEVNGKLNINAFLLIDNMAAFWAVPFCKASEADFKPGQATQCRIKSVGRSLSSSLLAGRDRTDEGRTIVIVCTEPPVRTREPIGELPVVDARTVEFLFEHFLQVSRINKDRTAFVRHKSPLLSSPPKKWLVSGSIPQRAKFSPAVHTHLNGEGTAGRILWIQNNTFLSQCKCLSWNTQIPRDLPHRRQHISSADRHAR